MLKKLGVVTVGITAGLLAAAPLASADEADAAPTSESAGGSLLGAPSSSDAEPDDTADDSTATDGTDGTDDADGEESGTGSAAAPSSALTDVFDSDTAGAATDRSDDSFAGNQANVGVLGQRLPLG